MSTFIILRRDAWSGLHELEIAAGLSSRVAMRDLTGDVRWIRSYITQGASGRLGMVRVSHARDLDAVREHARLASLRCGEVIPVLDTVVIDEDPATGRPF